MGREVITALTPRLLIGGGPEFPGPSVLSKCYRFGPRGQRRSPSSRLRGIARGPSLGFGSYGPGGTNAGTSEV